MNQKKTILLADAYQEALNAYSSLFGKEYRLITANSLAQALLMVEQDFDLLVTEITFHEFNDGIKLLNRMKEHKPTTPIVVNATIADFPDVSNALKSILVDNDRIIVKCEENSIDKLTLNIQELLSL